MPEVSVEEIIERAKLASDQADGAFVSQTDWLRWLNVEKYALDVAIARAGMVLRQALVTITATGAASYPIDDPLAIVGVYELKDSRYRRLRAADTVDSALFSDPLAHDAAVRYSVVQEDDNQLAIQLWPRASSGTYV